MVEYKQGKEIINTFNHIDEILFYLYDSVLLGTYTY